MRLSLNPRDPTLHAFLTQPQSLLEDKTYATLRKRVAEAKAKHRGIKAAQEALEAYVCSLLRNPAASSIRDEQRAIARGRSNGPA